MSKKRKAIYVGRSVRTPASACLNCGEVMDGMTGVGHKQKPKAGAICICMKCSHLQSWTGSEFRPLTDEQIVAVAGDEVIVKAVAAISEVRRLKAFKDALDKFLRGE